MPVKEIWRYPVKSLQGERLSGRSSASSGSRETALPIWDLDTGLGLTALGARTALRLRDVPGGRFGSDRDTGRRTGRRRRGLSDWLGRRVELRSGRSSGDRRYENPTDFEREGRPWRAFSGSKPASMTTRRYASR